MQNWKEQRCNFETTELADCISHFAEEPLEKKQEKLAEILKTCSLTRTIVFIALVRLGKEERFLTDALAGALFRKFSALRKNIFVQRVLLRFVRTNAAKGISLKNYVDILSVCLDVGAKELGSYKSAVLKAFSVKSVNDYFVKLSRDPKDEEMENMDCLVCALLTLVGNPSHTKSVFAQTIQDIKKSIDAKIPDKSVIRNLMILKSVCRHQENLLREKKGFLLSLTNFLLKTLENYQNYVKYYHRSLAKLLDITEICIENYPENEIGRIKKMYEQVQEKLRSAEECSIEEEICHIAVRIKLLHILHKKLASIGSMEYKTAEIKKILEDIDKKVTISSASSKSELYIEEFMNCCIYIAQEDVYTKDIVAKHICQTKNQYVFFQKLCQKKLVGVSVLAEVAEHTENRLVHLYIWTKNEVINASFEKFTKYIDSILDNKRYQELGFLLFVLMKKMLKNEIRIAQEYFDTIMKRVIFIVSTDFYLLKTKAIVIYYLFYVSSKNSELAGNIIIRSIIENEQEVFSEDKRLFSLELVNFLLMIVSWDAKTHGPLLMNLLETLETKIENIKEEETPYFISIFSNLFGILPLKTEKLEELQQTNETDKIFIFLCAFILASKKIEKELDYKTIFYTYMVFISKAEENTKKKLQNFVSNILLSKDSNTLPEENISEKSKKSEEPERPENRKKNIVKNSEKSKDTAENSLYEATVSVMSLASNRLKLFKCFEELPENEQS